MGWGKDLWDQQEAIEHHTDAGLKFVENCRSFVGLLAQAEVEFAKSIRKVTAQFAVPENDRDNSTCTQVWKTVLESVNKVAEQHEQVSSGLFARVCAPLKEIIKTKTQERNDILKDIAKLKAQLAAEMANLDKARKKYEKHDKEAEAAKANFEKIEKLESTTKKKEQEARLKWASKAKEAEAVLQTLTHETDKMNTARVQFFHTDMPRKFDALQEVDQQRAENLVLNLSEFAKCYKECLQVQVQAMDEIEGSAQRHNKLEDSKLLSVAYCSGQPLPGDLPVLDKGQPSHSSPATAHKSPRGHRRQPSAGPPEPEEEEIESTQSSPEKPTMPQRRMLYDFAGSNEGELPSSANELLFVVEDDGSGWVLCARGDGTRGYVPASYMQA